MTTLKKLESADNLYSITGNILDINTMLLPRNVIKEVIKDYTDGTKMQTFCYCDEEVSLQFVSGTGSKYGALGRVTLRIAGKYVEYIRLKQRKFRSRLR